jgi:hypothetical protein
MLSALLRDFPALSFKLGEIFTDQVEVEVVYGNVFVAHDVFE